MPHSQASTITLRARPSIDKRLIKTVTIVPTRRRESQLQEQVVRMRKGLLEDIKIRVEKISWFKTKVTVSARKFMLAKREFAGGVLYQIAEKLL